MRQSKIDLCHAAAIVCLAGLAPAAHAQVSRADSAWHGWLSLSVGPGAANEDARLAGDLGLWLTRNRLALAIRTATASRFLEPGSLGDVAVLAGVHPLTSRRTDVVAGAGLGIMRGHGNGGENLASRPALAFGAQANLNYAVVGLGLDAFASLADHHRMWGVGIALALGSFR